MSEESVTKCTKKLKGKKMEDRSRLTAQETSNQQRLDTSSNFKAASMEGSMLAEDQSPSNTPSKVKAPKKRKRTDRGALDPEFANVEVETRATEVKPRKKKKRDKDCTHGVPSPDPATDESLTEQSRKALIYAYERCRRVEDWKFNKAKQNWLLRNIWSEQAVPENYAPLVVEYLVGIKGGAREKLVAECTSKVSISGNAPMQEATQSFDDTTKIGQQPSTSRALSILRTFRESG